MIQLKNVSHAKRWKIKHKTWISTNEIRVAKTDKNRTEIEILMK